MIFYRFGLHLFILSSLTGTVVSFAPQFSAFAGAGHDAMEAIVMHMSTTTGLAPLLDDATTLLISAATEGSETATATTVRPGLINWENPGEALGGAITLLYIGFSILAGIKYVVKDGWRPKF